MGSCKGSFKVFFKGSIKGSTRTLSESFTGTPFKETFLELGPKP